MRSSEKRKLLPKKIKPTILVFPPNKKVFILDANTLMMHPDAMFSFKDNIVIIPLVVVEEIDHIKNSALEGTDKKYSARRVFRNLKSLRQYGSVSSGVGMPNGGTLYVTQNGYDWNDLPDGLERNHDNMIILLALSIQVKNPDTKVILISYDMGAYTKADALGIIAEEYEGGRAFESTDDMYTGVANLVFKESFDLQNFFTKQDQPDIILSNDDFEGENTVDALTLNQCCFVTSPWMGDYTSLLIYKGEGKFVFVHRDQWAHGKKYKNIVPRNDEQALALALVLDPSLDVVSVDGEAGTGKTFTAMLGALEQEKLYGSIQVYRAAIEADDTLGFAPGSRDEKFGPWTLPIIDAAQAIMGGDFPASEDESDGKGKADPVQEYIKYGYLSIDPPNHIRGRTLSNVVIILDEAQNITRTMMKMIVTRLGKFAKLIVVGDHTQIDRKGLDALSNGHAHLIARFKGQDNFAHITLKEVVRSRVAGQGAHLL
ncbi:MAG: PhoH family protein [Candidatus Moraniibacteriota bacterium]